MSVRRTIATIAVIGCSSLAAVAVVPAAEAQAPACATKAEFKKVKVGQPFAKVKKIFGGAPTSLEPTKGPYLWARWDACQGNKIAEILLEETGRKKVSDAFWG